MSATATKATHHHLKRHGSDASSHASHDHDRGPSSDINHRRPSVARSLQSKKKEEEEWEGEGAGGYPAAPQAPSSLARQSLEQYSVHIKGNATPITIDSAAMTTARAAAGQQQQLNNPGTSQQPQQAPQGKRVRFSALLRPPQRKPVAALQPQQALGGNPVTIHSGLADRRGRPALQAIRTRAAAAASSEGELVKGGAVRVYQDRPA
jgi:hypothetical protein